MPALIPVERTWERLPGITVPVLAVVGDLDASGHNAMAERVARKVPDGELATVEGTAHYPNMERPAEFLTLLRGFLQRTPQPRAHAVTRAHELFPARARVEPTTPARPGGPDR